MSIVHVRSGEESYGAGGEAGNEAGAQKLKGALCNT